MKRNPPADLAEFIMLGKFLLERHSVAGHNGTSWETFVATRHPDLMPPGLKRFRYEAHHVKVRGKSRLGSKKENPLPALQQGERLGVGNPTI